MYLLAPHEYKHPMWLLILKRAYYLDFTVLMQVVLLVYIMLSMRYTQCFEPQLNVVSRKNNE